MKKRLSQKAFDLIVRFETGGRDYYQKYLECPSWPGGASGVTIGFGYDLGYEKSLDRDWEKFLNPDELRRLHRCLGKTGSIAKQAISGVRDIKIGWEWAAEVFNENTLPQEIRKTLATYPDSASLLSADAFGGLVSLIFNRGTSLDGDRRKEMREIKSILVGGLFHPDENAHRAALQNKIAAQFRFMKRLWRDNKESDGDLVDRREAEAQLIESGT